MKAIAVYCGSSYGVSPVYRESAINLGKVLAKRDIALIYGGASVGLMGTLADTVLENGGDVIGVIPHLLEQREISHKSLTKLYQVDTMHERKAKMIELADGFIALPGGPGTLEELFEVITWSQIGVHTKPIGILNINGFYDPLATMLDHIVSEGFMQENQRNLASVDICPERLIETLIHSKSENGTQKIYTKIYS